MAAAGRGGAGPPDQVRLARRARSCWTPARRWSGMRTVLDAGAGRGPGVAAVRGGAHAGRDGRAAAPDRPVISVPIGRDGTERGAAVVDAAAEVGGFIRVSSLR